MNIERIEEIKNRLKGIGPKLGAPYTNQQMIDASKELQAAIASFVLEVLSTDYFRDRDVRKHLASIVQECGLEEHEKFKKLDTELDELSYTIGTYIKGVQGERIIKDALKLLEYDKGVKILYNIALEAEGMKAEYDAIVISPFGISTVEVKNWSGEIHLDKWGRLSNLNSDRIQYDVPGRMNAKEYLLRKCLGDVFPEAYQGILLFSKNDIRIQDDYNQIPVCYGGSIVNYIRSEYKKERVLSESQIDHIIHRISSMNKEQYTLSKLDSEEIINDFAVLMATIEDSIHGVTDEEKVCENNNSEIYSTDEGECKTDTTNTQKTNKINWSTIIGEAAACVTFIGIGIIFSGVGFKPFRF